MQVFVRWNCENLRYIPSRLKNKKGGKTNVVTPVDNWPPNVSQFLASNNLVKIENVEDLLQACASQN